MLFESDIKAKVLNHLINKGAIDASSIIISEFTLHNSDRRVDLAVYHKDKLIGIEIKSEADSLYRLEGQISSYEMLFDKVIVVVASKHTSNVLDILSESVAVWEVSSSNIKVKRKGKTKLVNDKNNLRKLLLKSDWVKLEKSLNKVSLLPESLSIKTLRKAVKTSLTNRFSESSEYFRKLTSNREISPEDLSLLSRYLISREIYQSRKESSVEFWENWSKTSIEDDLRTYHCSAYRIPTDFGKVPKEIKDLLEA